MSLTFTPEEKIEFDKSICQYIRKVLTEGFFKGIGAWSITENGCHFQFGFRKINDLDFARVIHWPGNKYEVIIYEETNDLNCTYEVRVHKLNLHLDEIKQVFTDSIGK